MSLYIVSCYADFVYNFFWHFSLRRPWCPDFFYISLASPISIVLTDDHKENVLFSYASMQKRRTFARFLPCALISLLWIPCLQTVDRSDGIDCPLASLTVTAWNQDKRFVLLLSPAVKPSLAHGKVLVQCQ